MGLAALAALSLHGALWVALKTEGALNERARAAARTAWWAVVVLTVAITIVSFRVQPLLSANFSAHIWGFAFPILAIAGLLGVAWFLRVQEERAAFLSSCVYLLDMLTSVAFSLYPHVLPASTNPVFALTVENAKAPGHGLHVGIAWWLVGMSLASAYSIYTYRNFAGKVERSATEEGY